MSDGFTSLIQFYSLKYPFPLHHSFFSFTFAPMFIYLDDLTGSENLFPFGKIKSVAYIRLGMLTILEKWQFYFHDKVLLKSQNEVPSNHYIELPAVSVPTNKALKLLLSGNTPSDEDFVYLNSAVDIVKFNDWALRQDFEMITNGHKREPIPDNVIVQTPENVFLEPGCEIKPCYINAEAGPVYISGKAQIMEGAMLRGPLFIGKNSVVKMGAKIYGSTTIGPFCMAGGEIKNSVLTGFSNKAHDGYLGDSVIGEWCNLGAGTSNSNLKNNASEIRITFGKSREPVGAGTKHGLIMGDYSRSAINTAFNTGTVIGICCNIFGEPPRKFVNSFSWGEQKYLLDKALEDINNWKKLKGFEITEKEKSELIKLYQQL